VGALTGTHLSGEVYGVDSLERTSMNNEQHIDQFLDSHLCRMLTTKPLRHLKNCKTCETQVVLWDCTIGFVCESSFDTKTNVQGTDARSRAMNTTNGGGDILCRRLFKMSATDTDRFSLT
jgi:hypothetical protein